METFYFPYNWEMKTEYPKEKNGYSVFSCFSCGGGSTMGYKLAGFDVIGCNEIDPKMMDVYKQNHNPKYVFEMPISELNELKNIPKELYNLDILDGSPPCSSFSMAGNREKDWGKNKKFREGQKKQVLDTLFFDFIDLTRELQPKIVIAENVSGILLGAAIRYVAKIYEEFGKAGYLLFHKLLDSSTMGVPQKRQRVFFFAIRKDLIKNIKTTRVLKDTPKLDLKFSVQPIKFKEIKGKNHKSLEITKNKLRFLWDNRIRGDLSLSDVNKRLFKKIGWFSKLLIYENKILPTITAHASTDLILFDFPRHLTIREIRLAGTFPNDYNFLNIEPGYLIGMSVPPVMMAQIAKQVQIQWLDKIYKKETK